MTELEDLAEKVKKANIAADYALRSNPQDQVWWGASLQELAASAAEYSELVKRSTEAVAAFAIILNTRLDALQTKED